MNRTGIPWCDWSSNPVPGYCPGGCPYCYAHELYSRRGWNRKIRFKPEEIATWAQSKPGDKIFVGSTIDLFHSAIARPWVEEIISRAAAYPDRIFIFLTKQYNRLASFNPWPANCWVGATVTDSGTFPVACVELMKVQAKTKFLSIEPLTGMIINSTLSLMLLGAADIAWLILGAMTGTRKLMEALAPRYPGLHLEPFRTKYSLQPPCRWVEDIINLGDMSGIPLFIKDNLMWPAKLEEWP